MRLLVSFAGGPGHFGPLAALGELAVGRGHQTVVAAQPAMLDQLARRGFDARSVGPVVGRATPAPLIAFDQAREDATLRDAYAGWIARGRADDLAALCGRWRPDVIVCDELDFGAMIVAERLALPQATVLVTATGRFVRPELIEEPLTRLRADQGLGPDPGLLMGRRDLVLCPFPATLRPGAAPRPATEHEARLVDPGHRVAWPPRWWPLPGDRPRLYATLGTVFNLESGDLFDRLAAGLGQLDVRAVLTVGDQRDPAQIPHEGNVNVERYVPQGALLPVCDLVVSHGGSGTVLGALTHGLAMVLLPMGADQVDNARRCADLGLAVVLDPVTTTPDDIAHAVTRALSEPSYAEAARTMAEEIAGMDPPECGVDLVEALVTAQRGR